MPIYEYLCAKCEHEFEREQRITEDPVKTCPKCRSRRVKRLISQTSFVLKGSGWYADGYGSTKDSKSDDSGTEAKNSSDSKSESKSDSKSDSKSEPKTSPDEKPKNKKKSKKSGKAAA